MDREQLQQKILEYEQQLQVYKSDMENYKTQLSEKDSTINDLKNSHSEEISKMNGKISELQSINQQYFLRLIDESNQVNNIETETPKKEKFEGGLSFDDFINKL